jgi:long-subunit acyl-CoA synthetase (AMP-forming)
VFQFAEAAHEHPYLKYIIQVDQDAVDSEVAEQYKSRLQSLGCKLLHFKDVEELGQDNPHDLEPPAESDLVTIEYTSGSTGKPKGIMQNAKSFSEDVAYVGSGHCTVLWEPLSHSERTNTYRRMMFVLLVSLRIAGV